MGPITILLVIILGALLIMVLKKLFERQPAPPPPPQQDLSRLSIADARVGDSISISGGGDNYSDLDFTADRHTGYEAGENRWFELSGTYKERRVALDVRNNDELEVRGFLDGKKYTIEELGLSEDDLAQIDQRQNTADNFEWDGKNWYFLLSREMGAFRDGAPEGKGFYGWEFRSEDGQRYLYVRKREGEPFSAAVAVQLNPADITVLRP